MAEPAKRPGWRHVPAESRLAPTHPSFAEIVARHDAALAAGRPTYADPATGFHVFTSEYLVGRGSCCDSGCRHCPYVDARPHGV